LEEDADLLALCRAGDEQAFEVLLTRHSRFIFNLSYRLLGNAADAEELAQEAAVRFYQSLGRFRGEVTVRSWLYRLVTNLAVDRLRRRTPVEVELDGAALPGGTDPQEEAERRETAAMVRRALNALPREERVVLVLRDLEDRSYQEIAAILDLNLGTVKSRIHRARRGLRERLDGEGGTW
jgi:RNA polymerase sigma-70 factor (ECF subfamily)